MDSEQGRGSSQHPRVTEAAIVSFDDSFEQSASVDIEHYGGIRTNSEITISEATPSPTENSKSSNSAPSSSFDFSSDDYFQVDPSVIPSFNAIPKPEENTKAPLRDGKNDLYSGPLFQLEEIFGSSRSNSPVSDVTHESCVPTLSPTQSPPIQVMERSRGFDPDRIPASIFSKPSSPMDWSVASNESLFSIQIGNNSFSRDHFVTLGGDAYKSKEIGKSGELDMSKELYKSGELSKSSELYRSGELKDSSDLVRLRQPSPVAEGVGQKQRNIDFGKTGIFEKGKENIPIITIKDEGEMNQDEANRRSDENMTNIQSFSFPKKKKSSNPSCHCTSCSCGLCSCKWPCCSSCSCKCPSCSSCSYKRSSCSNCSCKWPSCSSCSCKWPSCSSCSCKWPSCSSCSCKLPSCLSCSCKRPCCSCKCISWPSCSCKRSCLPSFCCKWPSCSGCSWNCTSCCCRSLTWQSCQCKGSTWPSCRFMCLSWSNCCCKCSTWLSCCSNCHFSNCSCAICNSWNCTQKRFCC